MFTLMSAAGSAIAGGAIDSSLGISGMVWWMAALSLVPGLLWTLWLRAGKSTEPTPKLAG